MVERKIATARPFPLDIFARGAIFSAPLAMTFIASISANEAILPICLSGQDLFNTSAAAASYFFPSPSIFVLAASADFPDALSGGLFMATGGHMGPLLLVNPTTPLPPEITPLSEQPGGGDPVSRLRRAAGRER
jgi:hypothetical protein